MVNKEEIRIETLRIRNQLGIEEIENKSSLIIKKLRELEEFKKADNIMTYISLKSEVNTKDFIREELELSNKKIIVPHMENDKIEPSLLKDMNHLTKGKFKVLEPLNKELTSKIDLILIPGVAFDIQGSRIGYGKGYYDEFLKNYLQVPKIALAFEEQITGLIKKEDHDVPVDIIITEERIINKGENNE